MRGLGEGSGADGAAVDGAGEGEADLRVAHLVERVALRGGDECGRCSRPSRSSVSRAKAATEACSVRPFSLQRAARPSREAGRRGGSTGCGGPLPIGLEGRERGAAEVAHLAAAADDRQHEAREEVAEELHRHAEDAEGDGGGREGAAALGDGVRRDLAAHIEPGAGAAVAEVERGQRGEGDHGHSEERDLPRQVAKRDG
ncbi:MAG: hypothetical protein IPN17_25245 [Deltaproteobacteria bacterium]|nr:hypothetical protein [Deltaproteobacteria bacterium]